MWRKFEQVQSWKRVLALPADRERSGGNGGANVIACERLLLKKINDLCSSKSLLQFTRNLTSLTATQEVLRKERKPHKSLRQTLDEVSSVIDEELERLKDDRDKLKYLETLAYRTRISHEILKGDMEYAKGRKEDAHEPNQS
jgi:hypothetical protein